MISRSSQRYSFRIENALKAVDDGSKTMDDIAPTLDLFKTLAEQKYDREQSIEWQQENMEYDLRSTPWILEKVRSSNAYAQNLYASMCNNEFTKNDVWPILQQKKWGCSWRYAGGIIADMQEKGDYIDWYCSGIRSKEDMDDGTNKELTEQGRKLYEEVQKYVPESVVTDEIREDLLKLGWIVVQEDDDTV